MFGQLPSQVLATGTMFDIQVANALAEWENELMNPNKKSTEGADLTQEQMMAMIKAVRK